MLKYGNVCGTVAKSKADLDRRPVKAHVKATITATLPIILLLVLGLCEGKEEFISNFFSQNGKEKSGNNIITLVLNQKFGNKIMNTYPIIDRLWMVKASFKSVYLV